MKIKLVFILTTIVLAYFILHYVFEVVIIVSLLLLAKLLSEKEREIKELRIGIQQLGTF